MNGSFRELPSFQVSPPVDLLYDDSTPDRYYYIPSSDFLAAILSAKSPKQPLLLMDINYV